MGIKKTKPEYNYIKEIMSEINDIDELPEGVFPISLKIIDQYQRKFPILMAKYTTG